MTEIALIGIDWGNTGFRAWVFDPSGEAVSAYAAQDGVALSDQDPWIRLADHFESWGGAWPDVPIIVCGAAGGEMGLEDVGYLERLPRGGEIRSVERDGRVVHIVPGVKQGFPPDTMRGEETLLVGLERPDGLVCLPGTHVKHVECDNGEVVWSKTSMVGEMRAMLLDRSTLRPPGGEAQIFDAAVFDRWSERALDRDIEATPFAVRAARLLGQLAPEHIDCALTAVLVGRDVLATYEPGDEVALVGAGPLCDAYEDILDLLGVEIDVVDAETAAQAGLWTLAQAAQLVPTHRGLS